MDGDAGVYYVAVQRDITAFRRRLAEADEGARTDALTGLGNRRALTVGMGPIFARPDESVGVLMMDIDRFKAINDVYGHAVGDAVLVEVANRIRAVADRRPGSVLVRIGGEEFCLAVGGIDAEAELAAIGEQVRASIEASAVPSRDGDIAVTVSVGASFGRTAASDRETLLVDADRALYVAKEGGRNQVRLAEAVPVA